jgi:hypothetical protein
MNKVPITGTPSTETQKLKIETVYEICLKNLKNISTDNLGTNLLNLYMAVLNISYEFF